MKDWSVDQQENKRSSSTKGLMHRSTRKVNDHLQLKGLFVDC